MTTILHISSSGRQDGSFSRDLSKELLERLEIANPRATIIERDIANGVEFVDQTWIESNFTPKEERNSEQQLRLKDSDLLVSELKSADIVVISTPIYNFSVPGVLKAWIDQICRAGLTFKYESTGPIGLLSNTKAYLVVTSGGTEVRGPVDFATDYLVHVLGFIGIDNVTIVDAGQLMADKDLVISKARETIQQVV